jgi:lipoprotein-releasing system permease protein
VSTLFMVVLEKRRDIGVLKSLGARDGMVLRCSCSRAADRRLGTALGLAGRRADRGAPALPDRRAPGDVYFIERLPVRPRPGTSPP